MREGPVRKKITLHMIKKAVKKVAASKPLPDEVNHPKHYQGNKYEVIDIIEDFDLGFCLGNAIKYILRAGKKMESMDSRNTDLSKAIWYINRAIKKDRE